MRDVVGYDLGTMFCVSAKQKDSGKAEVKTLRNMFLEIEPDQISSMEMSDTDLDYVEQYDDGEVEKIYVISEDAYRFSSIFGKDPKRPMSKGIISPSEIYAVDVMTLMAEKLIGRSKNGLCVYSIPAQPVNEEAPNVEYHQRVFTNILESLGYKAIPLNEALAIIYSECSKSSYSGISLSFGCGMVNVCVAYKGASILNFSINRGGDWIDKNVSESLNVLTTRVTNTKEKKLDLKSIKSKNKMEKRVLEALTYYYSSMIEYVLKVFYDEFVKSSDNMYIDEEIPIIISGGTSKPNGFVDMFKDIFEANYKDFPYDISGIRAASDPLNAVAKGCLVYGINKEKKKSEK